MTAKLTIVLFFVFSFLYLPATNIVPFWQEDFSNGQIPIGWTSVDDSPFPVLWEYSNGYNDGPLVFFHSLGLFPDERLHSRTVANGYIYIQPHGVGGETHLHRSLLTTQAIDCSNKEEVFISFHTFIMARNSDPETAAILEVRNGGTDDWTSFTIFPFLTQSGVEPNPYFPGNKRRIQSYNGQWVCIDISEVAAGQSEVYIRWRWEWTGAQEYCWLLDDVELLDANPLNEKVVWGDLPGEGSFEGGLNGWTVPAVNGCNWEWSAEGIVDYEFQDSNDKADGLGCSCTLTDGAAIMNGLCGPSENTHFTRLISPVIDLSGVVPGRRLGVRFNQSGAVGNNAGNGLPVMSVMVSVDGGQSFFDTLFLNLVEPFNKPFCKNTLLALPVEVAGEEAVVLKFVFSGSSFFWIIDDVRVVEMYDNDLKISEDYFAVAPAYALPAGVVRPIPFLAEVHNAGNLPQENTRLMVEVVDDETVEPVFRDTIFLGTIVPGGYSADTLFPTTFTPEPDRAYTVYYTTQGNGTDENPADNVASFRFHTQGDVFSKNKNQYSINSGFAPVTTDVRYEIGNCFYIPEGSNISAVGMQFAFVDAFDFAGLNVFLGIRLYRWSKGNNHGDANGDMVANADEFEKVAEALYQVESGLFPWDVIEVPFEEPVILNEDTYYFTTVEYSSPGVIAGQQLPFFISASEEINYTGTFDAAEKTGHSVYGSMLRLWGETGFEVNAWGPLRIPFIRLITSPATPVRETRPKELQVKVYPNPASGKMLATLQNSRPGSRIAFGIYDICGRLVLPRQYCDGGVSHFTIDVSGLRNGIYLLQVIAENHASTREFVVANR
ncbi:MAG TPA: T9SS type A sorting domain-containing protein [Bacteroidetes bacterium]|nr:T9SS type A sorting domain-containing protein [Bacteroidota bacterium]